MEQVNNKEKDMAKPKWVQINKFEKKNLLTRMMSLQ